MQYVTTIERMGIEKGRMETVTELLQLKFGTLEEQITSGLHELTYEQLKQLTHLLLRFGSLDDLRVWLQQQRESQA